MHPRNTPTFSPPPAHPFTRVAPAQASGAPRTGLADEAGPLAPYFRELSEIRVMTPEEEIAAAARIAALREAYWCSLLRHRPRIDELRGHARKLLAGAPTLTELLAVLEASALEPESPTSAAPYQRLAQALAEIDRDGVVSEEVFAGLEHAATSPPGVERPDLLDQLAEARVVRRELEAARGAFVRANLRLVVVIARRYARHALPLSDLIQEGNLGLIKAVDRYDHRRGFRFSTYASWWIRHAISRAMTDKTRPVRLPSHTIRTYNQVARARRDLEAQEGRRPDDGDIARITGVSLERIRRMNCSLREDVSVARPDLAANGLTLLDALADPRTPEVSAMMDRTRMLAALQEVLDGLSPMESDILRKRVGMDDNEEQTLDEIGETYSLSRERIRQVQVQALQKLRAEFKRRHFI